MLLQHGWLAPLSKPATILEADEDAGAYPILDIKSGTEDKEVAEWVINCMDRRQKGLMGESKKPALHAAPLDTVSPAVSPG
jgi:mitogen-activated protein kinase kinase